MRVLIVAAAVLACAAAAPSHGLLAAPYAHGLVAHAAPYAHGVVAHAAPYAVAPIAPALPTISSGDIAAAQIDAHVDASDHARASVDAAREYHDQASEQHGQAINAAEDHSWQAIDAVKTAEATLDGQAAGVAPQLAKSLVGHAPVAYAAPAYGHAAIAAPAYAHGYAAQSVVSQSLSQSHPAPIHHGVHAYAAPALHGYAAAPALHGYAAAPALHGYAAAPYAHAW